MGHLLCVQARAEQRDANAAGRAPTWSHATFDFAKAQVLPRFTNPPQAFYRMQNVQVKHFAVVNDGTKEYFDMLYHEREGGSGPTYVASMLDRFFALHSALPVRKWVLHADNTASQNRNNTMLAYFAWVVATRRFGIEEIVYEFLVVGHTHTRVDAGFGHCTTVLRRHEVFLPTALVGIIKGIKRHGNATLVTAADTFRNYDVLAARFFIPASGLVRTSKAFRFVADRPGVLFYLEPEDRDGTWRERSILRVPTPQDLIAGFDAQPLPPVGLTIRKQWLLYEDTRSVVADLAARDELCPLPSEPRPRDLNKTFTEAAVAEARSRSVTPTPLQSSSTLPAAFAQLDSAPRPHSPMPPPRSAISGVRRSVSPSVVFPAAVRRATAVDIGAILALASAAADEASAGLLRSRGSSLDLA
jgi:hypothetical protein